MSGAATRFADRAWSGVSTVLENVPLARDTYRIRLQCGEIAQQVVPGQFVMVRLAGCQDPLLARPLALYDTVLDASGEPTALDIVYLVVGKLTSRLARCAPGDPIEIWGPLGNGFELPDAEHVIMVAGGIGQTPFLALGNELLGKRRYGSPPRQVHRAKRVTLCYGARTADFLAGVEDFQALGIDVRISTDDGSRGHHGLVTDLLEPTLGDWPDPGKCHVVCCGPEPMMAAVTRLTARLGLSCQVSLETPMACGLGICFSCVARVRDDSGQWDYRRTCVEGPVFDAAEIVFD